MLVTVITMMIIVVKSFVTITRMYMVIMMVGFRVGMMTMKVDE